MKFNIFNVFILPCAFNLKKKKNTFVKNKYYTRMNYTNSELYNFSRLQSKVHTSLFQKPRNIKQCRTPQKVASAVTLNNKIKLEILRIHY